MSSKELVKSVVFISFLALLIFILFKIKIGLLYIFIALILTLIVNPFNQLLRNKFKIRNTFSSLFSISILISFFSLIVGLFVPILSRQGKNLSLLNTNEFKEKLDKNMIKKILEDEEIDEKMTKSLDPLDYTGLLKIASEFSDAVIRPKDELSKKVEKALSEISPKKKLHTIINDEKSVESHYKLYNEILN